MNLNYYLIGCSSFFAIIFISAILIKGRLKLKFLSEYWYTYINFILFVLSFSIGIFLNVLLFINGYVYNIKNNSSIIFSITLFVFLYIISVGIILWFIKLFRRDESFKNSIYLKNNLEYIFIFLPILNVLLTWIIYTILIIKKEKVISTVEEVYN